MLKNCDNQFKFVQFRNKMYCYLNVMAICARQELPLHNLAINPANYTSDCGSTFSGRHNLHHGNIYQSNLIDGAPDQITSVFIRCPGVFAVLQSRLHLAQLA